MKKLFLLASGLFLFVALCAVGSYFWLQFQLTPLKPNNVAAVSFVVSPEESASSVIQRLYDSQLIRSPLAAKIYLKLNPGKYPVYPGTYSVSPSEAFLPIMQKFSTGPEDIRVTLPEGWRKEQMAQRLHAAIPSISVSAFASLAANLEGQLFPDTYLLPPQADAASVVSILSANFSKKSNLDIAKSYSISLDGKTSTLSGREVLTLASLVERETKTDSERPMVAGILLRRLRADWPLQVDATLQYALGTQRCGSQPADCDFWQPPTDTKVPSAYNTYINKGLPPAPICNPGTAALNAVLQPQNSSYWYYLTGTDGVTRYSKSLQEHNMNVDKYLKS